MPGRESTLQFKLGETHSVVGLIEAGYEFIGSFPSRRVASLPPRTMILHYEEKCTGKVYLGTDLRGGSVFLFGYVDLASGEMQTHMGGIPARGAR